MLKIKIQEKKFKDGNRIIVISRGGRHIVLKTSYNKKGFGVQAFTAVSPRYDEYDFSIIIDDKLYESEYVGIWKFAPVIEKRIRRKGYLKTSHIRK